MTSRGVYGRIGSFEEMFQSILAMWKSLKLLSAGWTDVKANTLFVIKSRMYENRVSYHRD